MKRFIFSLLSLFFICLSCSQKETNIIITPNANQLAWADAEIGVLIDLGIEIYKPEYNRRKFGTHPNASIFNPTELNTDQWLETASKLGAKYAIIDAKHSSGFCLWPTEVYEYSVKNSPWKNGKGDIVADFIASCKKYGIKPGIYATVASNSYLYVDNPGRVQKGAPVTQEEYNAIALQLLTELWTNYGDLFEIWFDGGVLSKEQGGADRDILSLIQKLQPNAIAFQGPYGYPNLIRWVGNESGVAPYPCWATADSTTRADGTTVINGLNGSPDAPYWCPGETDFPLRKRSSVGVGWFWRKEQDNMFFSIDELMKKYETSVGRNTNMLLGLVVNDKGLIPDADVHQTELFGQEIIKQYGTPFLKTSGKGSKFILNFDKPTNVNRVIIQENIAKGERVLKYLLKGKKGEKWIELSSGSNIGHKRIERFDAITLDAIKLEIITSKNKPDITNFSVFETI